MGDSAASEIGFHSRAAALLKNGTFSDVEIQVLDGRNYKRFKVHKLFLAMGSPVFSNIFFEKNEACHDSESNTLKIHNFQPHIVHLMLQYLYTNKLDLDDLKDARELYTLSKKFEIRRLQELCVDYISQNEMNEDNVLLMYDCALKEKFMNLLTNCRAIVSSNTKAVFESPSFVAASLPVLKDIVQLENLDVDNELDIIHALIKWAHFTCRRQKLSDNSSLRECLSCVIPHIRFLSLKIEEFSTLIEKYNILSSYETYVITSKLREPGRYISFPDNLCDNSSPRKSLSALNAAVPKVMKSSKESYHLTKLNKSDNSTLQLNKVYTPPVNLYKSRIMKKSPVSKVYPLVQNTANQTYDLPLLEAAKHFSTAFNNDVKCSVSINMLKGAILIQGVILKITQTPNVRELINVILKISSSENNSSMNNTFNIELKDGFLPLHFKEPIKVSDSNPVEIEVTIEDLKLNRCSIIKNPVYQLTYGSQVIANLSLSCNQMNESGHFFSLIKRLNFIVV